MRAIQTVGLPIEELEGKGAKFTPVELHLPADMSEEDWAAVGRRLCRADKLMQWWLGDWAAFGLGDETKQGWRKYGALKEFAKANGVNYQTLRDAAWVSRSVTLSRRRDNVEWTKHKEVAALPAKEQTKWLAKVEREEIPRVELRRQIRQSGSKEDALKPDGPAVKFISKDCDSLIAWLRAQPAEFWTAERKSIWRKRLEPIVKFYNSIG